MLTVGRDAAGVERMLKEGSLSCPCCEGRLAPWGHARKRVIFGPGRRGRVVRPRRSRCRGCRVTHVLLAVGMLARRPDEAQVIGAALAAAARGQGHRRIARVLGVPADTVRGWLRRFAGLAGHVREAFTGVAAAVSADPVPLARPGHRWPTRWRRWWRRRRRSAAAGRSCSWCRRGRWRARSPAGA